MKKRALILPSLFSPSLTFACTVCDSDTGQQVRAGIFGDDFWSTLLAVISPFPVLLLALVVIHLSLPSQRPKPSSDTID